MVFKNPEDKSLSSVSNVGILHDSKQAYSNGLIEIYHEYKENMLRWGSSGEKVELAPAVVFNAPKSQRYDLDSVLGELDLKRRVELSEIQLGAKQKTVNRLVSEGKKLDNKLTYTMNSLEANDRIRISCAIGTYFDLIGSCTALYHELYSNSPAPTSLANLPMRSEIHARNSDPIHDGSARSAALGISMLLVYKDLDGTYKYFMRRRSQKVAEYPGMLHVVPSGAFQPQFELEDLSKEFTLVQQSKLEYVQEFYGISEDKKVDMLDLSSIPEAGHVDRLIDKGTAQLLFTGVAMNLYGLKPEVCTLLLIHDTDWIRAAKGNGWHRPMKMNWESAKDIALEGKGEIPLDAPLIKTIGPSTEIISVGAAAVSMGLNVAFEEIKCYRK